MPKLNWLFSIFAVAGVYGLATPVCAQAILPYTPQLDSEQLEENGLNLIRDVIQLARFGQYDFALPRARLAVQLVPNLYESWYLLGSLQVQLGEVEPGISSLQKARAIAPDEPSISLTLGSAYFQQGNYQKAAQELEAGLKGNPDSVEGLFDLGNAYLMLKRYGEAISNYQKAFDLESEFWPAINNIGLVKFEQGDVQGAIADWQTALTIDQEAAEPQLAIAVALYSQGKREEGIALGEVALNVDGRYADLDYLKENLWGERLIAATAQFLETPKIKALVARFEQ